MYQALIWVLRLRLGLSDQARRLRAAFDAKRLQGITDALVDRVRRNVELRGDLFRTEMLVDEQEAVELSLSQLCNTVGTVICIVVRIE